MWLKSFSGTALLLEWERFRAILPGGVPLDTLERYKGDELLGVNVLVLTAVDLEMGAVEDWFVLSPTLVLWDGVFEDVSSGNVPMVNIGHYDWVKLTTDGTGLWVEAR